MNVDDGRVILKHKTPSGQTWYTQYEHMTHILEGLTGVTYVGVTEAAELSPEEQAVEAANRTRAQAILTTMAQSSIWLEQGSDMAVLGNEGEFTTGSHIHQSLYDENGSPIDQYKWANDWQPGITHKASAGEKNGMFFSWNDTVNALVSQADGIAMQRINTYDNEGKMVGMNLSFALEGTDISTMRRVEWKSVKYEGESEARLRWVDLDDEKREWVIGIDGTYSFITHL